MTDISKAEAKRQIEAMLPDKPWDPPLTGEALARFSQLVKIAYPNGIPLPRI